MAVEDIWDWGGGEVFVCVHKHAHARGVWGYAPPEKLDGLRVLLRRLWPKAVLQLSLSMHLHMSHEGSTPLSFQCWLQYRPTELGVGPQCSETWHSCAATSRESRSMSQWTIGLHFLVGVYGIYIKGSLPRWQITVRSGKLACPTWKTPCPAANSLVASSCSFWRLE